MSQLQASTKGASRHVDYLPGNRVNSVSGTSVLRIVPKKVTVALSIIVFLLLVAHIGVVTLGYQGSMGAAQYEKLRHFFHLNDEENLPTFFSALLLVFAAALFYIIYKLSPSVDVQRKKWLFLSLILLFLGLDESLQIHERVNTICRAIITNDASGYLFWAWIIPYSILFMLTGLYFFKFYLQLPKKTRVLFFVAACMYFFGAVAIESIEGRFGKSYPPEHLIFAFTITLQEVLEMAAVIVLIHSLFDYISVQFKDVVLERH